MKHICIDCKNCIIKINVEGTFCPAKCKKHFLRRNYVSGEMVYEDCASINVDGECSKYVPTTSKKIKTFLSNIFNN